MSELTPLAALELVCGEIFDRWDKDQRSGKLLTALSGHMVPGYDPRVDLIREALSRRPDAPSAGEVVEVEPWGYETGEPFAVQPTARVLAEAIGDLATTDRRGLEQRVRGLILRDRATVRQRWEGVQRRAEQAEARAAKLERDLEAFQAALPAPPQADGGEG